MQPDESNFLFLADLYGEVPTSASEAVSPQDEKKNQDKGGKRLLRDDSTEIPQWVMEKWRSLESNLENHAHNAERRAGWRLLHENEHGEAHEIDIGGGYRIQVHKLLASEDS